MVDEESIEVWFPVSPPDRISPPERDPVFTNSAGRIPQAGGIIAASTSTHRQDAARSRPLVPDRACRNVPPTANLFRLTLNNMPVVKTLKNSVAIHIAGSPLYADASSITLAMTRVSAKATPYAMPMNRAAMATLDRDCLLFVFPSSHRARHAGLCKKRPCSRAQ